MINDSKDARLQTGDNEDAVLHRKDYAPIQFPLPLPVSSRSYMRHSQGGSSPLHGAHSRTTPVDVRTGRAKPNASHLRKEGFAAKYQRGRGAQGQAELAGEGDTETQMKKRRSTKKDTLQHWTTIAGVEVSSSSTSSLFSASLPLTRSSLLRTCASLPELTLTLDLSSNISHHKSNVSANSRNCNHNNKDGVLLKHLQRDEEQQRKRWRRKKERAKPGQMKKSKHVLPSCSTLRTSALESTVVTPPSSSPVSSSSLFGSSTPGLDSIRNKQHQSRQNAYHSGPKQNSGCDVQVGTAHSKSLLRSASKLELTAPSSSSPSRIKAAKKVDTLPYYSPTCRNKRKMTNNRCKWEQTHAQTHSHSTYKHQQQCASKSLERLNALSFSYSLPVFPSLPNPQPDASIRRTIVDGSTGIESGEIEEDLLREAEFAYQARLVYPWAKYNVKGIFRSVTTFHPE